MLKSPAKLIQLPVHPWLISAIPILHLYSHNFGLVIDSEIPALVFWMLMVTTIGFVAAYAVSGNIHKAALITTSVSLLFSLSGHFHSYLAKSESLIVWTPLVLIAMAIVVTELSRIRSEGFFDQVTLPLNLVSLALILMQVVALYSDFARPSYSELTIQTGDSPSAITAPGPKIHDSRERPDIYYIIPDRYPSDDWLQNIMGHDNSPFTEALRAREFEVIPHAQSNYGATLLSLSSTLNMRYVTTNPTALNDEDYLRHSIADSEVARHLQGMGYTYVQLLSGYLFPSQIADINRDFTPAGTVDVSVDEHDLAIAHWQSSLRQRKYTDRRHFFRRSFLRLYLDTTLLKPIADHLYKALQRDQTASYDMHAPERFLNTLEELEQIAAMPEATFTFVHLLQPHVYVDFDQYGNIVGRILHHSKRQFSAELVFLNSKFIEMVDRILEGSRHPPVIIIQSDHGRPVGWQGSGHSYFEVYSAYHLPDSVTLDFPRPFTNVNTFPLVLNAVLGTDYGFQEDQLFGPQAAPNDIAAQEDVTDLFAHKQ